MNPHRDVCWRRSDGTADMRQLFGSAEKPSVVGDFADLEQGAVGYEHAGGFFGLVVHGVCPVDGSAHGVGLDVPPEVEFLAGLVVPHGGFYADDFADGQDVG